MFHFLSPTADNQKRNLGQSPGLLNQLQWIMRQGTKSCTHRKVDTRNGGRRVSDIHWESLCSPPWPTGVFDAFINKCFLLEAADKWAEVQKPGFASERNFVVRLLEFERKNEFCFLLVAMVVYPINRCYLKADVHLATKQKPLSLDACSLLHWVYLPQGDV